ncbi:MAG: IscS subfamily cysteine desulfurase [Gammaproteobacteria bacterium]|nr:MAG: IscS subfamily cysteine desulfurase [Gammaproteobacteria bacterium]
MSSSPIYLDYAATTPVDPVVVAKMIECLGPDGYFGNPASRSHVYGWQAEQLVEQARKQTADMIGCDVREVVWTSGATESDNLAIKGVIDASGLDDKHIITSAIEHKAVLDTCAFLESEGCKVTYLKPSARGVISVEQLKSALTEQTCLVSLMHVNNETGAINDIEAFGNVLKEHPAFFHVDAAQSIGKLPVNMAELNVDLMSMSAHKIYGPKGIGMLYVSRSSGVKVAPQIHGGGHERGMRSGTLATHQIVGLGQALSIANERLDQDTQHILTLKSLFLEKILAVNGVQLNGDPECQLPGIVNVSFSGVEAETLLLGLNGLAVSSGSACTSTSVEPSYVLKAMGVPDSLAYTSLRFSFGRFTTVEQVKDAANKVVECYTRLR